MDFSVELLNCHKETAHKRLGRYGTPNLWSYAKRWWEEKGELFSYNGYLLYEDWPDSIKSKWMPEHKDHGLLEIAAWAKICFHNTRDWRNQPGGNNHYQFLRFPDGHWIVGKGGHWLGIDFTKKDKEGRTGFDFRPYQDTSRYPYHWTDNCTNFSSLPQEILELYEVFPELWKKSRAEYRKEIKKNGEVAKREADEATENHVERTDVRMRVALQITKLKDNLDLYLKSVTDATMTVAQVGEVYSELIKLAELGKEMKSVYGNKMPSK